MCDMLKHHRYEIRDVVQAQKAKPDWVDKIDWDYSKRELYDDLTRWEQQKKAKQVAMDLHGSSHLGSGGKVAIRAWFVSVFFIFSTI